MEGTNSTVGKEYFEKEISLCRDLSRKNDGKCAWGECEKCGVIPLLHKLYDGRIYERKDEVDELRRLALK